MDGASVDVTAGISDIELDNGFTALAKRDRDLGKLKAWSFTGTVIDERSHSETYVSGGGNNGAHYINPVSSSVVNYSDFWLKQTDGTERRFSVSQSMIDLRVGHQISLVHTNIGDGWRVSGAYNHNTGLYGSRPMPFVMIGNLFLAFVIGVAIAGLPLWLIESSSRYYQGVTWLAIGPGMVSALYYFIKRKNKVAGANRNALAWFSDRRQKALKAA